MNCASASFPPSLPALSALRDHAPATQQAVCRGSLTRPRLLPRSRLQSRAAISLLSPGLLRRTSAVGVLGRSEHPPSHPVLLSFAAPTDAPRSLARDGRPASPVDAPTKGFPRVPSPSREALPWVNLRVPSAERLRGVTGRLKRGSLVTVACWRLRLEKDLAFPLISGLCASK
ncbi:hypothetical protein HPB50_017175 [Hyalomma asiaticum]|uniref:Uncharacterized protein n=1 Tax=Hyalomma asiaticum TaxID=266040 RepID=A0ACB7TJI6_HYAAI|nr:hypothetical protein HPB50_017175 [Hyalomma asiaticum]